MANWLRIEFELTDSEESAASEVFDNLVPAQFATREWSPVRYATAIHNRAGFAQLLEVDLGDLLDGVASFDLDGVLMVSPEGTLRIAEVICACRPADVLAWVMSEEANTREACAERFAGAASGEESVADEIAAAIRAKLRRG